jgi:hypothetical protein
MSIGPQEICGFPLRASVRRSPRAVKFGLRASVDPTPVFSPRENAIAKEPGSSYPARWRRAS